MKAGDRVVITGSEELVGEAAALVARGVDVVGLGWTSSARTATRGDVRDAGRVAAALVGCQGAVHLAIDCLNANNRNALSFDDSMT